MSVTFDTAIVGGHVVRYVDASNSVARDILVLIHGFPLGVQMWEPQLSAFDGWRVVAPALPGFDGADSIPDASMDVYARQVLGLIDTLHSSRVVLCGLSMGGYVALSVMRQAADRISGLILADTRSGVDSLEATSGRLRMLDLVARDGASAVAASLLPKLFGPTSLERRPEVVAEVRRMMEAQSPDAISVAIKAMMTRPDSGPLLPLLRLPTLILVGEEDTLIPPSESEQMHAAIAGSVLVPIPEAGHMSNVENPAAFNEAVNDFLRQI